MATLEEILTSWGAVYAALFLPAILMLINFVFGKCFVSDALSRAQHAPQSTHSHSRVIGRAHVALITLSFFWQYYVVMFVARTRVGGNADAGACNPLYSIWDAVDSLPWLTNVRAGLLFHCDTSDLVYLALVSSFAVLYYSSVFSVPQVSPSLSKQQRISKSGGARGGTSHCRRCDADVVGMDHHCYLICNCVGAGNKSTFLWCLVSGIANMSYLLYRYAVWVFLEGDAITNLGALLVAVIDAFLIALFGFQVLLWRRGWTTRQFLKARHRSGESVWRSAARLLF